MGDALLITGRPGVGKTTLVKQLAGSFPGRAGGFLTEEVRKDGSRVGFGIVTLDGQRAVFAHVGWQQAAHRVGRYGVDVTVLDRVGVAAVRRALAEADLVVVDEIGKMELQSEEFRRALEEVRRSPLPLVATIMLGRHPWAERFRRGPGLTEVVLNPSNRQEVLEAALRWVQDRLSGRRSRPGPTG
ncbi:MAG: AAA family ATPase [candidate division GAL15 bacterium]